MKLQQPKMDKSIDLMRKLRDTIQKQDMLTQSSPHIHIEFGPRSERQHIRLEGDNGNDPVMQACFSDMKEHLTDMLDKKVHSLLEELSELGVVFS